MQKCNAEAVVDSSPIKNNVSATDYKDTLTNDSKMNSLVKSLENSINESLKINEKNSKSTLKHINNRSDEIRKQNKQVLNALQQQYNHGIAKSISHMDTASSYSTISMVHLQYKYEELLVSHEGLLKLLESKVREIRKCCGDNDKLESEVKILKENTHEMQNTIKLICEKFIKMKNRKDKKICKLLYEKDTLKMSHDKLVELLHRKCMEDDSILCNKLGNTQNSLKAQLINEIRRSNKLQYENTILTQKCAHLKAKLRFAETIKKTNT